ncbi:transporter substrate-binding domain-containing protein [Negadavirga shengliensis]|uniref:Transporter substrate-binding domain-containing protein n=1 Tax=Negadavirga shengliensis TaxID=1389218 RepID=A0ABV9SZU2_9BACT
MLGFLVFWVVPFILIGCENFPKDPENTLKKVHNGTLRVGYSENPPWVVETDNIPIGIEPELVKDFAKSLNAEIEWINDTEQNLFDDLGKKKLHLVVAGITSDTPWKKKVGLTRPFAKRGKKKQVMAVIQGENAFIVQLERFLYQQKKEIIQP